MWKQIGAKKLGVMLLALLSMSSVVYAINMELLAEESAVVIGNLKPLDALSMGHLGGNETLFMRVQDYGDGRYLYSSASVIEGSHTTPTLIQSKLDAADVALDDFDKKFILPNSSGKYFRAPLVDDVIDTSISGCQKTITFNPSKGQGFANSCFKTIDGKNKLNLDSMVRYRAGANISYWFGDALSGRYFYFDSTYKQFGLVSATTSNYVVPTAEVEFSNAIYFLPANVTINSESSNISAYKRYIQTYAPYSAPTNKKVGIRDDSLTISLPDDITAVSDGTEIKYSVTSTDYYDLKFILKKKEATEAAFYGLIKKIDSENAVFDFSALNVPAGSYELYVYAENKPKGGFIQGTSNIIKYDDVKVGMPSFKETPEQDINYFETKLNANANNLIGEIKKADASITGVNYTLTSHSNHISDGHAADHTKFKFEESGDKTKDVLKAAVDLNPGIYYFQIVKLNADGSQDSSFSLNVGITVYPSRDSLKFDIQKQVIDGTEKNYTTADVNNATGTPKTLGTSYLEPAAGDEFGTVTFGFKNTKLNGTSVSSGNEDFQMHPSSGKITKKDMISYGKHEFTSTITYAKDGKEIVMEKGTYSFYVDPIIYYVDPQNPTNKITQTNIIYDETASDHSFTLLAKSDDAPVTSALKYRLKSNDISGILTYSGSGGKFVANKAGTTKVEAYYNEGGVDIVVTEHSVKVAANPIKDITYTFTPQKDSANVSYLYLAYQKNVARDTVIGHITSKDGAKPITYVLSDSTNFTLKENTDAATKDTQPYVTDANGNVLIYANKDLDIGKLSLTVQAYDSQNEPYWSEDGSDSKYGIDADGNKVAGYDKGRISDAYEIVVYPNESQITSTQNKKSDGSYYSNNELNQDTSIKIGDIEFASSAKIQTLFANGYVIDNATIVNAGTTSAHNELTIEADATNKSKFYLKGKGNLSSGRKEFDVIFTFKKSGTSDITATITKRGQSFYIAPELKFGNPDKPTEFLSGDNYSKYYDPENKTNTITMIATDNGQANTPNTTVKYCVLNGQNCTESSDVIEITDDGYGTASIKVLAPGTEIKTVMIRAYVEGGDKATLAKRDMEIKIQPAKQILTWEGKNIQTTGNHITKDDDTERTWNLSLKYDKDNTTNNSFLMTEIIKGGSVTDKTITLRDDVIAGTTTNVSYAIQCQDINDTNNIEIKDGKLNLKGELKGDVTIIATAEATGNYSEAGLDDTSTTDVNEDMSAKLLISVSNKAKVAFTKSYEKDPKATSDEAQGKVSLGELNIDPDTETGYTFTIDTVKQKDESKSTEENEVFVDLSSSKFQVKVESNRSNLYASITSPLSAGTYLVKVKAAKDKEEATAKEIRITIGFETMDLSKLKWQSKLTDSFSDMSGSIDSDTDTNTETLKNTFADKGTFYAKVENKEGTQLSEATIKYALSSDSVRDIIEISEDGKITMKGATPKDGILKIKATITKEGYEACDIYLPILIEKGDSSFQLTNKNGTVYTLANANDKTKYNALELAYGEAESVDVFTKGAPEGSKVIIEIKDKGASKGNDVLSFKEEDTSTMICEIAPDDYSSQRLTKCQVSIKNALFDQLRDKNKIVYVASIEETDNYKAMSVELPINVVPAEQTDFNFAENELYYESNQEGLIEPIFQSKDDEHPNISTGKITLLTSINGVDPDFQEDEVWLDDSTYNPDDEEYTEGIRSFGYNIVIAENEEERVGNVYAQKEKDRNFKVSEIQTLTVHVMPEGTCQYQVTIKNYPSIGGNPTKDTTYGDAYFSISAKSEVEDTADPSATYAYEIDEGSLDYLAPYGSSGNEFTPRKAGTKVKIKITRTSGTGVSAKPVTKIITIKPKEVKLKVVDIHKKNGMALAANDIDFTPDSGNFLASDQAHININYIAQDANGTSLIDMSEGVRLSHNNLPIKATIENKDPNTDVLSNYKITKMDGKTIGIEDGKLTISEDESDKGWYEIKTSVDTSLGMNDWYNGPLDIILKSSAGSYDQISQDGQAWERDKIAYDQEGMNDVSVYFRQSSGSEKGAIAKAQSTQVKIDATAPEVVDIKATITHQDVLSKLIRALTFNTFMKPGEEVTIHTQDVKANSDVEISTTNNIPDGITYSVYELNSEGERGNRLQEDQKADTNGQGIAAFTLDEPGTYEVCATVNDQAGNSSSVFCEKLLVKKIDYDEDGDGKKDFIDSDNDGCPDLDIVLKDKDNKNYKINIDRDGDGIADLNIDSDGDGIAEINVDTDRDGTPDLNLLVLTKEMWKPTRCIEDQSDRYCTTPDLKPLINIDQGNDDIPDIDIDNDGDMKADLNISNGKGKALINITKLHEWKPSKKYHVATFAYDSIGKEESDPKPELNIDTNDDGYPDINLDLNGDGKPELNIDWNGDFIPDTQIDTDGDGKVNLNIDHDGNGIPDENVVKIKEWKAEKIATVDGFTFGTMEMKSQGDLSDGGVTITKPDGGTFLPNYALKVNDVTEQLKAELQGKASEILNDQIIHKIYDVQLIKDDELVKPDGKVSVKVPVDTKIKNPRLMAEKEDGSFDVVDAQIVNGYFVYETDYLGCVIVIGDEIINENPNQNPIPDPTPDPKPDPQPNDPATPKEPVPSVKGNYTSNMGGALTGDDTQCMSFIIIGGLTILIMLYVKYKQDSKG